MFINTFILQKKENKQEINFNKKSPFHVFRLDGDKLMNDNFEYLPGSASLPTSPVAPVAPSSTVASRLARSSSDSQAETGTGSSGV